MSSAKFLEEFKLTLMETEIDLGRNSCASRSLAVIAFEFPLSFDVPFLPAGLQEIRPNSKIRTVNIFIFFIFLNFFKDYHKILVQTVYSQPPFEDNPGLEMMDTTLETSVPPIWLPVATLFPPAIALIFSLAQPAFVG